MSNKTVIILFGIAAAGMLWSGAVNWLEAPKGTRYVGSIHGFSGSIAGIYEYPKGTRVAVGPFRIKVSLPESQP